ncbi:MULTISPECIES: hypothetical protein [unclassified Adlercreutzia]|uniref:hypothetical protein n=1 Tax=unclassified Adlercreutzia TaxID=2636013 RepID=UPI0013EA1528|nr:MULTISPECIES: hypothetical protein [unclassified Adlercreutzia]
MKKSILTVLVMIVFGAVILGVGFVAEPKTSIQPISATSPCPVTGCASGVCHGFDDVPAPDGIHEMACPEASCTSVECHALDTLYTRYHQASDASLNIWILMPVVLVVSLVVIVRLFSRGREDKEASND